MSEIIGLCIDIVAGAIILLMVIMGFKKGFAAMFLQFVAWLAGGLCGGLAASYAAPLLYENFFAQRLLSSIGEAVEGAAPTSEALTQAVSSQLDSMGGFVRQCVYALAGNDLETKIASMVESAKSEIPARICDEILAPALTTLLGAVIFLVVFVLVCALLRGLSKKLEGRWNIPLIGGINTLLGGVAGLLRGAICAALFLSAIWLILLLSGGEIGFLNSQTVEKSYLLTMVSNFFAAPLA